MNLKSTLLATGLVIASSAIALAPQTAHAADNGTITISGKVMNSTCDVNGGGATGDSFTVTLPPVAATALATSGDTAAKTSFSINLSGCPTTPAGIQVGTQFFSSANADGSGHLNNSAGPGFATNVAVQLLDSADAAINVTTSQASAAVTDPTTLAGSTATLDYAAQYYATGGATAGDVSTTVQYVINYQ